mgnify:CR=1 FL=1
MSKRTSSLLLLTLSSLIGLSSSARAEHCRWRFDQSFTLLEARNLRAIERGASADELQAKAEAEAEMLFGPPAAMCEEGSYGLFLERFERFATAALRMKGTERDARLRVAAAIIRRAPATLEVGAQSVEAARPAEASRYDQVLSNLGAIADDAGGSLVMRQLIDAIKAKGPPKVIRRSEPQPPEPHATRVYVPTVPLPGWAVISLYEIADHAQRKEPEKIQGKVEAILNWMKTVEPKAAPK